MNDRQLEKVRWGRGVLVALGQSGSSIAGSLSLYGIGSDAYSTVEEMLSLAHAMRSRLIMSADFDGTRIFGAILIDDTLERTIGGMPSAQYLWAVKGVVPFLNLDAPLSVERAGARQMEPIPELDTRLARARELGVFGAKARSVLTRDDGETVAALVDQQFELSARVRAAGLVPIIEPEVDASSPEKAAAERLLEGALRHRLDGLDPSQQVMLQLALPEVDGLYSRLTVHPNVLRVVAISGGFGYDRLARNPGVSASFLRSLIEGLSVEQDEAEFDASLGRAIAAAFEASTT
jgi:fructose-bisphosphate aldolase class I